MDYTNLINEINLQRDAAYRDRQDERLDTLDGMLNTIIKFKEEDQKRIAKPVIDAKGVYIELLELMAEGSKINAIKRWREISGWGLIDSKNFIDELMKAGGFNIRPIAAVEAKLDTSVMKFYANLARLIGTNQITTAISYVAKELGLEWERAARFVSDFDNA